MDDLAAVKAQIREPRRLATAITVHRQSFSRAEWRADHAGGDDDARDSAYALGRCARCGRVYSAMAGALKQALDAPASQRWAIEGRTRPPTRRTSPLADAEWQSRRLTQTLLSLLRGAAALPSRRDPDEQRHQLVRSAPRKRVNAIGPRQAGFWPFTASALPRVKTINRTRRLRAGARSFPRLMNLLCLHDRSRHVAGRRLIIRASTCRAPTVRRRMQVCRGPDQRTREHARVPLADPGCPMRQFHHGECGARRGGCQRGGAPSRSRRRQGWPCRSAGFSPANSVTISAPWRRPGPVPEERTA